MFLSLSLFLSFLYAVGEVVVDEVVVGWGVSGASGPGTAIGLGVTGVAMVDVDVGEVVDVVAVGSRVAVHVGEVVVVAGSGVGAWVRNGKGRWSLRRDRV